MIAALALAVATQHVPAPAPASPSTRPPAIDPACPPEHAAMGHCTPKPAVPPPVASSADPACPPEHAAMGHCTPTAPPAAVPAGPAKQPDVAVADYADRVWGREAMAPSRRAMRRAHGGGLFSQVMVDQAEVAIRDGRDGYRWDGEGWYGGDIHRLTIRTEGEGGFGEGVEQGEVQALYSRAIGPYFNLQAGVRQDFGSRSSRTHAAVAFEGLAPYWFEVEGALFLSDRGDVSARIEGYYDQRVTQRLILQPRAEVALSAQDVPATRTGSGLTGIEAGARLRYEIRREFAPYVGVIWERSFGDTARFARAAGEGTGGWSLVLGLRTWF